MEFRTPKSVGGIKNKITDHDPIITAKEARKILGRGAKGLSDGEVETQIRCYMLIAKKLLVDNEKD